MSAGQVFEQNPGAGSNVKRTTTIRLVLAKAAPDAAADDTVADRRAPTAT